MYTEYAVKDENQVFVNDSKYGLICKANHDSIKEELQIENEIQLIREDIKKNDEYIEKLNNVFNFKNIAYNFIRFIGFNAFVILLIKYLFPYVLFDKSVSFNLFLENLSPLTNAMMLFIYAPIASISGVNLISKITKFVRGKKEIKEHEEYVSFLNTVMFLKNKDLSTARSSVQNNYYVKTDVIKLDEVNYSDLLKNMDEEIPNDFYLNENKKEKQRVRK